MLQLFLLFLAGNVVVGATAYLFCLFLRREPNLVSRRDAIFEMNCRPVRIEAGEAELAASRTEMTALQRRGQDVQDAIRDRVPLDDPPTTTFAYTLLGLILFELEAGVVFLLSGPVAFLSLSLQDWAFVAALFSAGWIVLLHVLIGSMVADKHRPARTIRRAKVGAVVCGVAVITGAWLTLSGRNITNADLVEQLAGVGLMVLALLLSFCAAFCTIVATTLLEAQRHERELLRVERLRDMYARHIQLLEKDLVRIRMTPNPRDAASTAAVPLSPPSNHPSAGAAVPAGVVPTALMLLGLILLPAVSQAQNVMPQAAVKAVGTEAHRASTPGFARAGACEVLVDVSSSVDRSTFQAAVAQISSMLPLIINAFHCSLVRLAPFAGDLFVSLDEIALPAAEDEAAACRSARPATSSARSAALDLLYPTTVAAAHQQAAVDACFAQREPARQQALSQRRAAISQAAERLRILGTLDPRGPCTALPQAIKRALMRSQQVLVISDGVPTCTPPVMLTPVPTDGHLIFLLVPPGNEGTADRANLLLDRLNSLEGLFPGGRALFAPEATASFWLQVGAAK